MSEEVAQQVQRIIERLLPSQRTQPAFDRRSSILELGFDSLLIAELAVALEEGLGIREFPMQEWADAESSKPDPRFTVGSMIDVCTALLAEQGPEVLHGREDARLV